MMLASASLGAQPASEATPALAHRFDFWLGTWQCQWTDDKGDLITGSNTVSLILGGRVIEEQFRDPSSGFEGMSISILDPRDSSWHQTWVDNAGGHFNFTGAMDGAQPMFISSREVKGIKLLERMVFRDIQEDAFTWDWEKSIDGGATWTLSWRIHYTRMK
jgi:hypothetical protein